MKAAAVDVPPPGPGLNTVTLPVVGADRSPVRMAALNCVLLTNTVARSDPFQRAVELLMKLAPNRFSVKPRLPAVALAGDREASVGSGLAVPVETGAATKKPTAVDVPPPGPGLNTATCAVVGEARSEVSTVAVNW